MCGRIYVHQMYRSSINASKNLISYVAIEKPIEKRGKVMSDEWGEKTR